MSEQQLQADLREVTAKILGITEDEVTDQMRIEQNKVSNILTEMQILRYIWISRHPLNKIYTFQDLEDAVGEKEADQFIE